MLPWLKIQLNSDDPHHSDLKTNLVFEGNQLNVGDSSNQIWHSDPNQEDCVRLKGFFHDWEAEEFSVILWVMAYFEIDPRELFLLECLVLKTCLLPLCSCTMYSHDLETIEIVFWDLSAQRISHSLSSKLVE